jgi:hypothetical protein
MVYYESISSEVQAYRTELIRRKYIDTKKLFHMKELFLPSTANYNSEGNLKDKKREVSRLPQFF